jgi:hypothetical protein
MSRLTGPIVQPAKRTRCYATAMSAITFSLMTRRGRRCKRSAFADMLEKHDQPVGFKAALEASVTSRSKVKRAPTRSDKKPRERRG